ncbi:MAG: riboflavin synthase [Bacillota bacterium]|jgi:riboflavin synthase
MFTGLVEELGAVVSLVKGAKSAKLTISASKVLDDVKIGDSIAVSGVCLTVTTYGNGHFQADVMAETLDKSNLGQLKIGEKVNLERALCLGDRLGGHLVSGHIDGVGTIKSQKVTDIAVVTKVQAPPELLKYVIRKGSIAVDGISLTIVDVDIDQFTVSLIPHTAKVTTLGYKSIGDKVNIETDVIGKYVEKLLNFEDKLTEETGHSISLSFLSEHGFN